MIVFDWNEH